MRKIFLITFAFLCLCQFAFTSNCPEYFTGDLLKSGTKILMKGGGSSSELLYEAPISFPVPSWGFQFTTTTASIQGYNPSRGFNFLVNGRRKGSQGFIQMTVIINPDQAWSSVQLSYLVSARNDFVLWNANYASNNWSKKEGSTTYDIAITVPKNLPQDSYKVAAFISGFSTTDSQFLISIDKRFYDQRAKILTITINCRSNPPPVSISISYIIYPQNHPALTIYYGKPRGEENAYQISGPISFGRDIEYNQFSIAHRYLACSGNLCQNSCILTQRCLELYGNAYQGQCIFCALGVVFQFGLCTMRCGPNQIYQNRVCICLNGFVRSGKDCVSKSDNQNGSCRRNQVRIRGQCHSCPFDSIPNAEKNTCICSANQIYDNNANTCNSNQKPATCTFGYFLDGDQCFRCVDNCIQCSSIFECNTCALGYSKKELVIQGQKLVSCEQICGDGIKYQQQCDDGNTRDGDGCSSKCQEQKGWSCSGGSSNNPSVCKKFTPDQIQLSVKGVVNLGSEVVISVHASNLPPCMTKNECRQCFKALRVEVIDVKMPALVSINYIPLSHYQFLIKVDFKPKLVTSMFKVIIRLNPDIKGCFTEQDLFQQIEVKIDPVFGRYEKEELSLQDIISTVGPNKSNQKSVPESSKR